ncbi:MAG: hypothetical protein PHY47_15580 [Lachnospiraceae bacterium]|nr:hypothetical protein [Lachnospiraceae bacterium]
MEENIFWSEGKVQYKERCEKMGQLGKVFGLRECLVQGSQRLR